MASRYDCMLLLNLLSAACVSLHLHHLLQLNDMQSAVFACICPTCCRLMTCYTPIMPLPYHTVRTQTSADCSRLCLLQTTSTLSNFQRCCSYEILQSCVQKICCHPQQFSPLPHTMQLSSAQKAAALWLATISYSNAAIWLFATGRAQSSQVAVQQRVAAWLDFSAVVSGEVGVGGWHDQVSCCIVCRHRQTDCQCDLPSD